MANGKQLDINKDEELNVLDIVGDPNQNFVQSLSGIMNQDYNNPGIETAPNMIENAFNGNNILSGDSVNNTPALTEESITETITNEVNNNLNIPVVDSKINQVNPSNVPLPSDSISKITQPRNEQIKTDLQGNPLNPFAGMKYKDEVDLRGKILSNEKVRAEIAQVNAVTNKYRDAGLKPFVDKKGNIWTVNNGVRTLLHQSPLQDIIKTSAGHIISAGFNPSGETTYTHPGLDEHTLGYLSNDPTQAAFIPDQGTSPSAASTPPYSSNVYPKNYYVPELRGKPTPGNMPISFRNINQGGVMVGYLNNDVSQYENEKQNMINKATNSANDYVNSTFGEEGLAFSNGTMDYNFKNYDKINTITQALKYESLLNDMLHNNQLGGFNYELLGGDVVLHRLQVHEIDQHAKFYSTHPKLPDELLVFDGFDYVHQPGGFPLGRRWVTDMKGNIVSMITYDGTNATGTSLQGDDLKKHLRQKDFKDVGSNMEDD
tara:strand:- start:5431 stop:6894 length:1464 start_codon:yes stop_codon:yes gene_type:complete